MFDFVTLNYAPRLLTSSFGLHGYQAGKRYTDVCSGKPPIVINLLIKITMGLEWPYLGCKNIVIILREFHTIDFDHIDPSLLPLTIPIFAPYAPPLRLLFFLLFFKTGANLG